MNRLLPILCFVIAAVGPSGCKIVKDKPAGEIGTAADQTGDDARNAIRLEETFEGELLPHIEQNALPLADLRALVTADFDAAGAAHANRGAGQGAAWNFPVKGEGMVVVAKLDTRARTVDVDTDADGAADVTLQLGPVIRGTALRDAAPFYNFDDFRDQIEFARLSRALNDRILPLLIVPDGALVGKTVRFVGVIPLKSASEALVVTPTLIAFEP